MNRSPYDVAIIGEDASGLAAAYALSQAGRRVVVITAPAPPLECALAEWTPAALFLLPQLPPGLARAVKAVPFQRVRYLNAALDKQAELSGRATAGYLLPGGALRAALAAAARAAGAKFVPLAQTPAVEPHEDGVCIHHAGREVQAKVALLTAAAPAEALQRLAFQAVGLLSEPPHAAAVEVPLPGKLARQSPIVLTMVEPQHREDTILFFQVGGLLHLRLIRRSARPIGLEELAQVLDGLQQAGLAPGPLPAPKALSAIWSPPAGVAMEMLTHVARRSLLAGPAGGFADFITAQTLLPGVSSALTAAQVIHHSLSERDPQVPLAAFDDAWQGLLARQLAPPSTPLSLLLPLVFVNSKILARFTAAVLRGQDI